jgi:hypothetical protein
MSNKTHFNSNKPKNNLFQKKNHYFKHKNLKEISKRETYLGWREITKRQVNVSKTGEKFKENTQHDQKKKNQERKSNVVRRRGNAI